MMPAGSRKARQGRQGKGRKARQARQGKAQSVDPGETESGERCGTGGADVMYTAYVHGVLSGVLLWYRDMVLIFPNGDFPPNDPTIWHSS